MVAPRKFPFPIQFIMKSSFLMFLQLEHADDKRHLQMLAGS